MRSWNLGLAEVSGLALRRDPSGAAELIAISDRSTTLARLRAAADDRLAADRRGRRATRHHAVGGLPADLDHADRGSQWEGVAAVADGRVLVLREYGSELLVLSPDLHFERRIALRHPWEGDGQAGLESLLLLRNGHVVSAKQRDPLRLLEFGPAGDEPAGLTPTTVAAPGEPVALDAGAEWRCLGSWEFAGDPVPSANDLAVHDGQLYVISSAARAIVRVPLPASAGRPLRVEDRWPLPRSARDGGKAEGLLVDERLGVLVALDAHAEGKDNLFRLGKAWPPFERT